MTSRICKSCGAVNRPGEMICRECGDLLFLPTPSNTAKLRLETYVADVLVEAPHLLQLKINGQVCQTPLRDGLTVLIGRDISDLRGETVIDLFPLQAAERGVSREHAAIYVEGASVFVTDLESTNGTYLNGRLLRPHQPYILRSGDVIHFGRLEARVQLG